MSAVLSRSQGASARHIMSEAQAVPSLSVSRIRVPRARVTAVYRPPGMDSAHVRRSAGTSVGGWGQSVAGTTGMASVIMPAWARACWRAPEVVDVPAGLDAVVLVMTGHSPI